jgi:hypothetical protein
MRLDARCRLTVRSNSNWTTGMRCSTEPWFISWSRWANSVVKLNGCIDINMFLSPGTAGTEVCLTLVTLRPVYAIHHRNSNNSSYCHTPNHPLQGGGGVAPTSSLCQLHKKTFLFLMKLLLSLTPSTNTTTSVGIESWNFVPFCKKLKFCVVILGNV